MTIINLRLCMFIQSLQRFCSYFSRESLEEEKNTIRRLHEVFKSAVYVCMRMRTRVRACVRTCVHACVTWSILLQS